MEANSQLEKNCTAMALLFRQVISDMKNSTPVWEDFTNKATKLHSSLRSTVAATTSFLEAFQKVADMATNTRGATRDIGSALTRLCMRHRSIESKLKAVTSSIMDAMVMPLQEKMEDWKKAILQLEKERNKDTRKSHQDVKKALAETSRLQKKLKKGRFDVQKPLDDAVKDLNEKLQTLKENEKSALRAALIEERARYCLLIQCIKPFMDGEISLLGDVMHLQEIMDSLCRQATDPLVLPEASEQIIVDISESSTSWTCQIPAQCSPIHSMSSSKSSLSSLSSSNSSSLSLTQRNSPRTNSMTFADSERDGAAEALPSYAMMMSSICGHWPGSPPLRISRQREICDDRPHTISSAYERNHVRSALGPHTFQPPSSQVSSMPTTPNPHIMCMRAARTRPHSLARNVEIAELFSRGEALLRSQGDKKRTSMVDSTLLNHLQNMQPYANISDASDLLQSSQDLIKAREEAGIIMRKKPQDPARDNGSWKEQPKSGSVGDQPPVSQHSKAAEVKTSTDGTQQSTKSRSIHHSFSCSVIGSEQVPAVGDDGPYTNTNGNIYEHIYSEIPKRVGSVYISDRQPSNTRRASLVVGTLDEDRSSQALLYQDQKRIPGTQSKLISEINPPMCQPHPTIGSRNDHGNGDEEFLLPPSPFRSPDNFQEQVDHSEESRTFATCFRDLRIPQNFGLESEDPAEQIHMQVWKTAGQLSASDKEFLDERLRNPWQEISSLMTMSSPDDTTPTNENQPGIFPTNQKISLTLSATDDSVAQVVKNLEQMDMGPNRESSI